MGKKREINEYRQVKDSVYKRPKSHGNRISSLCGLEIDLFVEEMVNEYPNYYSLGQALHHIYLENKKLNE